MRHTDYLFFWRLMKTHSYLGLFQPLRSFYPSQAWWSTWLHPWQLAFLSLSTNILLNFLISTITSKNPISTSNLDRNQVRFYRQFPYLTQTVLLKFIYSSNSNGLKYFTQSSCIVKFWGRYTFRQNKVYSHHLPYSMASRFRQHWV